MSNQQEALQRAKALIIAKNYDDARQILSSIQHDPTATLWLAKLDQIAPTKSNTSGDSLLQHAKQLIIDKQYDAAREILEQFPDHPTAQQWLAKLNQVAPPQPSFATSQTFPQKPPERPKLTQELPALNPWNPSTGFFYFLLFAPIALFFYPLNWRRLGKSEWAMETFLIGILTFGALISSAIIALVKFDDDTTLKGIVIGGAMVLNTAYWLAVENLQEGAYKTWKTTRDPLAVINHNYPFKKSGAMFAAFLIIGSVIIVGVLFYGGRTSTLENDVYTVEYRNSKWQSHPTSEIEICREQPDDCDFVLGEKSFGSSTILFTSFPINPTFGLEAIDTAWWQQSQTLYPYEIQLDLYERTTLDGLSGFVREFSAPENSINYYYRIINVVHGSNLIQIQMWASDKSSFEDDRKEFEEIINSIDFK